MGIGDQIVAFAPHHGRDFGVGFHMGKAIHHMRAGPLQAARLQDVGGFVKAGF